MPYNTTPIRPRKEVTGQVQLPLSRVKKIIAVDPDISVCSNNAAFAITLATELFVQYLAEQGHNMAKMDKKPRRNIQYKDLSSAITHKDNLEFLDDTIPKTLPYRDVKLKAAETRVKLTGAKGITAGSIAEGGQPSTADDAAQFNGSAKKRKTPSDGFDLHNVHRRLVSSVEVAGEDGDVDMTG